jgi:RuvB-like protein 1 (pontin 52)
MLIIRTLVYTIEEIIQIIAIRAATENITVDEDALVALGAVGDRTSLRYAVQLITPSKILANTQGRDSISADDVKEIDSLFFDAKASAKILADSAEKYLQ